MAGVCAICNNLEKSGVVVDDKVYDSCACRKGKFLKTDESISRLYTLGVVLKPNKILKDIQDSCDCWDDRLKGKS